MAVAQPSKKLVFLLPIVPFLLTACITKLLIPDIKLLNKTKYKKTIKKTNLLVCFHLFDKGLNIQKRITKRMSK